MTLNEFYTTVGGNYEDVIVRLHSEAFTEKFLRMIPQDNSLPLLRSRDTLPEQTDVLLRAVDREYQKVCDTLARLNPHTEPRKTT